MKDLIKRVREIDPKAAEYLESEDKDKEGINWTEGSSALSTIMLWAQTPQGHSYWEQIATQLGEEY